MNIPIVFAFSNKYFLPGWISIASLLKTAKQETKYLIHVLYDDLDEEHIKNLSLLVNKSIHEINFTSIPDIATKINLNIVNQNWPRLLFARLYVSKIFPVYQKIIVSDVDILFKKDLQDIFNKNLSKFHYALIAAEKNSQKVTGHKRYDFYQNEYIYYSGFVIYNTKMMIEDNICGKFDDALSNYKEKLKNEITDLVLLNMCSNSIYRIPFNYCVLESLLIKKNVKDISEYRWLSQTYSDFELEQFRDNPYIIHYSGHGEHRERPWDRIYPPDEYKKYIDLSPYRFQWIASRNLKKILRKNQFFLNLSNTKVYRKHLKFFFKRLSLFLAKIFHR